MTRAALSHVLGAHRRWIGACTNGLPLYAGESAVENAATVPSPSEILAAGRRTLLHGSASPSISPWWWPLGSGQDVAACISSDLDDVERVFVAALQESELDTADQLLALIEKRFPRATSRRVQLMHGLRHEAAGDYSAAMRVYDDVLKRDPACVAASKRRVVVLRAQGNPGSAVTALNAHLEIHVADAEAWEELLAVYVHAKQWSQAAHCAEELILLRPTLYGHYLNYADIVSQLGTADAVAMACKNYAKALELADGEERAIAGIQKCIEWLNKQEGENAKKALLALDVHALRSLVVN